jgi:hypothetical protein
MQESIKDILMRRDGISSEHADELIDEARKQLYVYLRRGDMASAEEVCAEFFGLEPDFVLELI